MGTGLQPSDPVLDLYIIAKFWYVMDIYAMFNLTTLYDMKVRILSLLTFCCLGIGVQCQSIYWHLQYPMNEQNELFTIHQLPDGFITVGAHDTLSESHLFLLKTDTMGIKQWHRSYDIPVTSNNKIHSFISNDSIVVFSRQDSISVFIARTNGDSIFYKKIHENPTYVVEDVIKVNDGYVIPWRDGLEVSLEKYGNDFSSLWTNNTNLNAWAETLGMVVLPNNEMLMTGCTGFVAPPTDPPYIYLSRIDAAGDTLWATYLPGYDYSMGQEVITTSDGNYLVAATRGTEIILWKFAGNGNTIWVKSHDTGAILDAISVFEMSDDNILVAHKFRRTMGNWENHDPILYRFNSTGDYMWYNEYTAGFDFRLYRAYQFNDDIFLCGYNDYEPLSPERIAKLFYLKFPPMPVSITEASNTVVSLFPNPTTGYLTLTLPAQSREVLVTNWLGEVVHQSTITNRNSEFTLDLSSQPKGLYLVTVVTENGRYSSKVVVE